MFVEKIIARCSASLDQIKPVHTSLPHLKIKCNVILPSTMTESLSFRFSNRNYYLYHFHFAPATCPAHFFFLRFFFFFLLFCLTIILFIFVYVSKNHASALAPVSVLFITKNVTSINISCTTRNRRTQQTVSLLHRK